MTEIFSTEAEVVGWISYYEEGGDLPDEVMVKILYMAQLYAAFKENSQ